MTEENLNPEVEKTEKCNCFCHSKGFRNFLITALGTFVGVYCALCLFTAIHRPPIMPHPMMQRMIGCPCMYHHLKKYPNFENNKIFHGERHLKKHMDDSKVKFDEHAEMDD